MARNTVRSIQGNTSMNPIRLASTDTPQTLQEGINALTDDTTQRLTINTGNTRKDSQRAIGADVIVSAQSILIAPWRTVPTLADFINTTLTATAVINAVTVVSPITGISANQVTLTPASMTGIQAGMKVIITVTDNYNGTFYVESITATTFNIASAFTAETTSTSDLVKSAAVGITIAAGEIYELSSTEDVVNFRYVSAATGVVGTLDVDLKFGG